MISLQSWLDILRRLARSATRTCSSSPISIGPNPQTNGGVKLMDLQSAITAAEAAKSNLVNADAAVATAQGAVDAAQAKLDSANSTKATAVSADNDAKSAYKGTLSDLASAVQAEIASLG